MKIQNSYIFYNTHSRILRDSTSLLHLMRVIACAQAPLVWCVYKIACATSVYDTYYLGHLNEENERTKASNLRVYHFSLTFVNTSLA